MPPARKHGNMERKEVYPVQLILDKLFLNLSVEELQSSLYRTKRRKELVDIDGDMIHPYSLRYFTFLHKGISCVECGIKGVFFAKERHRDVDERYHLNLYAINDNGEEVLMTKDHIYPKSLGGPNHLSNMQPMCKCCNESKSNLKKR